MLRGRIEENIRLVERGRLDVPPTADLPQFLLSDGKLNGKPVTPRAVTLANLFRDYRAHLPMDSMEANSLKTAQLHMKHLTRILGRNSLVQQIGVEDLQRFINSRSAEPGRRGRPVSPVTIKKELSTFSGVWRWAKALAIVEHAFPNTTLKFPKTEEKPPFQTWAEIERQIARGGLSQLEQEELWDCLYLTLTEIEAVLKFAHDHARQPFLYPMLVMAAHTGARRSELLRSRITDFDFAGKFVRIREKKRDKGKRTMRVIPITRELRQVMLDWCNIHPGGNYTFCHRLDIARSKSERTFPRPLTVNECHDHFRRTFSGRWRKIRGWHVFRHSFISNCACQGIDQRMVDAWAGHQSDEMRKRYTHLFPNSQHTAISRVFD